MAKKIQFLLLGAGALLFIKYIVLGLCTWNSLLHPERIESPDSPFLRPLLGIFGDFGLSNCASVSARITY